MPLLPEELADPPDGPAGSAADLRALGVAHPGRVCENLAAPRLVEAAVARGEAVLTTSGALAAYTGGRTGRSPRDRYVVREPSSEGQIAWGKVNQPIDPARFDRLFELFTGYLQSRDLFVLDGAACADPAYRLNVRVVAEHAWHALFARCLFLRPARAELEAFRPDWTVLHAAGLHAVPGRDGTRSEVFVGLHFGRRLILVAGTHYAGEIKKAVFSVLNYLLPQRGVFPMHCSANVGAAGDVALFFGLSGTGKTTLSADPNRRLIGDDEHAWSDSGVFNVEGGCYAKTIGLSREREPQIYDAIRFGCVLENVPVDPRTREPDYGSQRFTENTRAAYPVDFIPNCDLTGRGGHPANIFFLTCDAFGVLPPLAKLTPDQAMYHFLSGYTAKAAGTEVGVTEPEATFSTCFAEPFLPLPPARYAQMLRERLDRHRAAVWLLNTGWTGGPFGVGRRMSLPQTRALLHAALAGQLANVSYAADPVFGVLVPKECPGVPSEVLWPRRAWPDPAAYDAQAHKLAELFRANFRQYEGQVSDAVRAAGPKG
jgi:phosphoenolpyruvate carboxykinase (ATP)